MKQLLKKYNAYHPDPKPDLILCAYELSQIVFYNEKRLSGEAWVSHSLALAKKAVSLKMDTTTICVALIYDAGKFGLTPSDVAKELNDECAYLFERVVQMSNISKKYRLNHTDEVSTEYIRKLILHTGYDIRAVVLRLLDKSLSLKTIDTLNKDTRERSLHKALYIYGPIAGLLGIGSLKRDLEEMAFKLLYPNHYNTCRSELRKHPLYKLSEIHKFISELRSLVKSTDYPGVEVTGRRKGVYSFYKKVKRYEKKFDFSYEKALSAIPDIAAVRIVTPTTDVCYKFLDLIYSKYGYINGSYEDYIKLPKDNGYRSIHVLVPIGDSSIEFQIRTREMHEFNEIGPASYALYKVYGISAKDTSTQKVNLLRNLVRWKDSLFEGTSLKITSSDDIIVFTPKGDAIELPGSSTVLDFAYAVHTTLGNTATQAFVNGILRPLDYTLTSGDVILIVSDRRKKPLKLSMLSKVKTKRALLHLKKEIMKNRVFKV